MERELLVQSQELRVETRPSVIWAILTWPHLLLDVGILAVCLIPLVDFPSESKSLSISWPVPRGLFTVIEISESLIDSATRR
jgi:hypothetical protein